MNLYKLFGTMVLLLLASISANAITDSNMSNNNKTVTINVIETKPLLVLISDDGGANFSTLAIDHNATFLTLNDNDFQTGDKYVIKVLATDGVNTGRDTSNGNFTIILLIFKIEKVQREAKPMQFVGAL